MEVSLIFVYHNDEKKKIKVLSLSQAKERNDDLLANGWKHTATIDPRHWIEYLFNETEAEDIVAEIRELSTSTKRTKVVVLQQAPCTTLRGELEQMLSKEQMLNIKTKNEIVKDRTAGNMYAIRLVIEMIKERQSVG